MEDVYQFIQEYKNDSEKYCCNIKIFSPMIDDKERKRRMEDIKNTAAVYMSDVCRVYIKKEK